MITASSGKVQAFTIKNLLPTTASGRDIRVSIYFDDSGLNCNVSIAPLALLMERNRISIL